MSNKNILEKIIEIGNMNNFVFYYHDNSLSKDVYAIDIIC